MRKLKFLSGVIGLAAVAGFSAPAVAGLLAENVSNVQVNWSQGEGLTIQDGGNPESIYYAGLIDFTINGVSTFVWCDDLYNDVYIGSSDQYYLTSANSYLSPLTTSTIHDIAGLVYEGTTDASNGPFTSALGAEFQLAIWELEYDNIQDTADAGVQTGVNSLIAAAPSFYSDLNSAGWTYSELDSPGCGLQPDAITYSNGCQTQGQMYVYPNADRSNGPAPVPEPSTLTLLASGLLAFGGLRFQRKTKSNKSTVGK